MWMKCFPNNYKGFKELECYIKKCCNENILACIEATGFYGEVLADFLYAKGCNASN